MAEIDGRVARRRRNREAVIEAAVSLMQEGVLDPSVDQITERSGVSPRSVFRYFESLDDMRRAVLLSIVERSRPLLDPLDHTGSLEERVARLVDARLEMFERVAGAARAARLREPQVPTIADDLAKVRSDQRVQLRAHFRPELEERRPEDAEQLAALLEMLLSFEAWDQLRRIQGREADFVR
ncbi:MAG: TetR/AcrR family transcriptional regulator, partial [Acidimicrobiales bacterium]